MNGGQSRRGSLVESLANIAVGVGVAFVSQLLIFGYYGIHVGVGVNARMTLFFTAVSLVRSFVLRRVFNKITTRKSFYVPGGTILTHGIIDYALCLRCGARGERWNNVARDGRCQ